MKLWNVLITLHPSYMALQGITFEALWKMHRRDVEVLVLSILHGRLNHDSFQQLVAAAQIALWRASLSYDATKSKSFWAYAVYRVRGAVMDELRSWDHLTRGARKKVRDEEVGGFSWGLLYQRGLTPAHGIPIVDDIEQRIENTERLAQVLDALVILSPIERLVFNGVFLDQRTLAQIGEQLGVTEGRVCQIKHESITKLRTYLDVDRYPM